MARVNYDEDGRPEVPDRMWDVAEEENLQVVHVDIRDGEDVRLSPAFACVVPFLPRPGDRIRLEDGRAAMVTQVEFVVGRRHGELCLYPEVVADPFSDDAPRESS